jgi:tRNA-specific 2-thiouridylase
MSGGVDSSVAAALVLERGFEAVGVTMHLSGSSSRCCSMQDADDARSVADKLGIRFFVANYSEAFRRDVIEPFADDYLAGRTPIPCVACNTLFKFQYLLERAKIFGADRVASGHYARIDWDDESRRHRLLRARDLQKDQTYFLFQLTQQQLACTWFPLGEMTKSEVRERARKLDLATAEKAESQEICFVPDGDYAAVVERVRPEAREARGEIVDSAGRVLGEHRGIHHFTVGQRRGLGIAGAEPLYVQRLEPKSGRVVVGGAEALESRSAQVAQVSWIAGEAPKETVEARVKVRSGHAGTAALLEPQAQGRVRVLFREPVRAVAPGQAAVFYDAECGEAVLGGGWIAGEPR